jgi:cell division septation protein DedD
MNPKEEKIMKNRSLPAKARILFLSALIGAAIMSLPGVQAATITVINTNDSGPGSLRQALSDANNGDTIDFDSSLKGQTITLTSGQLLVNRSVTISGLGANNLTVDGNAKDRVFLINPANTVTISGLTIMNGSTSGGGGGIRNDHATLTVSDCAISGNSANGGGVYNNGTGPYGVASATLTVSNSTLNGNSGNGIRNEGGFPNFTTLTVSNCTISGNSSGGIVNGGIFGLVTATITNSTVSDNGGSGIFNSSGTGSSFSGLTVTNSTVSGNSGGGIANRASNGGGSVTLTVTNSTLSGNSAPQGGGVYNLGGVGINGGGAGATIINSTLSGNSASNSGGGIVNIGDDSAAVTITNSTLSGNSAPQGGGIANGFATLTVGDTILNAGASGENIYNVTGGTVSSLGYNLSSDNGSGYLTGPGDQINTDPMLGALQDNGGPTFTHALLPSSPAIDTGDPNFTPPPFYDQRGPGFNRVVNGRIDIGSFEVQGPTPIPTPTPTATHTPTPTPTAIHTPTATPTATFPPSPTPTATATSSPRPTPTPRSEPTARPRPTSVPRP